MVKPSRYTTINTGLATFLAISKVKLVSLDTTINPAVYTFEANGELEDLIAQWKSELTPFRQYYNTYRAFIDQIKGGNGENSRT